MNNTRFLITFVAAGPGTLPHEVGTYVLDNSDAAEANEFTMIGPMTASEARSAAARWNRTPAISPNGTANDWTGIAR